MDRPDLFQSLLAAWTAPDVEGEDLLFLRTQLVIDVRLKSVLVSRNSAFFLS